MNTMIDALLPVSATQLGACDTTAQTLKTLTNASEVARVPYGCVFRKEAGTAWTVSEGGRLEIKDDDGNVWFSIATEGFLDQATAQSRFTLAEVGAFTAGNKDIKLSATAAITTGSGSPGLTLKVYYTDIPLVA